jgi:predicted RNA-binding Zn ribbon-like protein
MVAAPAVPVHWLVEVVNEYGHRPRAEAGESAHPYPALTQGRPPQAARLTEAELTALADRLWPVFGAPDPAARVTALNSLLSAAKLTPEIDGHGDQAWRTSHTEAAQIIAAGCAVTLLDSVSRNGWHRLGICDGADCVDVYLDEHGRAPRRYCSAGCLNRARIRAYRSRHATSKPPGPAARRTGPRKSNAAMTTTDEI